MIISLTYICVLDLANLQCEAWRVNPAVLDPEIYVSNRIDITCLTEAGDTGYSPPYLQYSTADQT
jgi:hypothetical protein